LLLVVAVVALAFVSVSALRVGPPPEVKISAALPGIGARTPVTVTAAEPVRGLGSLKIELLQGDDRHTLAEKTHTPRRAWKFWGALTARDELKLDVGSQTVKGLRGGEAVLRVTAARAGTWLRSPDPVVSEIKLPVRLVPPPLEVVSIQHYVSQGGAEAVVYRVGETAVRDGVEAGARFFPGFPLPGGGPLDRFALFAVPYNLDDPARVELVASDDVGNTARRRFVDKFFAKPPRTDTIRLDNDFMKKVVPEIRAQTPQLPDAGGLLENYLAINGELRRHNAEELDALASNSAPRFLWREPFTGLPNGKVMSAFADRRTYVFEGREVDHQDHLGFDMASTRRAPVPASNDGVVALARYFGIYGNTVVLDHGYGLMTLYAHLSSFDVKPGDSVARGQTLGHTGDTGLAGGDHLHFTVLLHGLPTNPAEWWDGHWIRDRLARKLGSAFGPVPPENAVGGSGGAQRSGAPQPQ
jgi:murein DD-endopeptidase MepM/ murein hydrolase activator NlpD